MLWPVLARFLDQGDLMPRSHGVRNPNTTPVCWPIGLPGAKCSDGGSSRLPAAKPKSVVAFQATTRCGAGTGQRPAGQPLLSSQLHVHVHSSCRALRSGLSSVHEHAHPRQSAALQ